MDEQKQMNISIKPEVATGKYANLAIISHSKTEFIIDFAAVLPGLAQPEVTNRILMSPEHCKRLLNALADNVSKYESQFGRIGMEGEPKGTFNIQDFNPNGNRS